MESCLVAIELCVLATLTTGCWSHNTAADGNSDAASIRRNRAQKEVDEKRAAFQAKLTTEARAVLSSDEIEAIWYCQTGFTWVSVETLTEGRAAMEKAVCASAAYIKAEKVLKAKCDRLAVEYRNTNPEARTIADAIVGEVGSEIRKLLEARSVVYGANGWSDPMSDEQQALTTSVRNGIRSRAISAVLHARMEDSVGERE